jgi:hypothetical protein
MPAAMKPLATITLSSAQATVTFSSITSAYRDLVLVTNISTTSANDGSQIMRMNGDTASNYSNVWLETGVTSSQLTTTGIVDSGGNVTTVTNSLATIVWNILDYSATDKHKQVLVRENTATSRTAAGVSTVTGRWANTAAITSIVLLAQNSTTYAAGSTFTLYGVSA